MTWKKTLKRAPGVPASPLSSTQKMPRIVDVGWEMGGREACTWGHMWVCKRQRPQVLGEKQTAQIGLQVLGSKRTVTLRHDGVNIVSSRCCGSWHYNRKLWNNPDYCFTILKKEWVEMGGARRQAVYQIKWPAFGRGGPWVVGQRCSPNSPKQYRLLLWLLLAHQNSYETLLLRTPYTLATGQREIKFGTNQMDDLTPAFPPWWLALTEQNENVLCGMPGGKSH